MTVPSSADGSLNPKCVECGAAVLPKAKFCPVCGASQAKAAPAPKKCIACGAEIPESSKFCDGCGASQSTSPTSSFAQVKEALQESIATKFSEKEKLILCYGLAAVLIVWACIDWFNYHPTSPEAQYELGVKYAAGQGIQRNDAQAVYWYRKAAEHGSAAAKDSLSMMYATGRVVADDDDEVAVYWYRKDADQGNAGAEDKLGEMYESGRGGLQKDDAQAVYWYQKAADQGEADAEYLLGVMYENGRGGLTKDNAQAISWYQKAADQGNADALASLKKENAEQQDRLDHACDGLKPNADYSGGSNTAALMGCSYGFHVDSSCSITCYPPPVYTRPAPDF